MCRSGAPSLLALESVAHRPQLCGRHHTDDECGNARLASGRPLGLDEVDASTRRTCARSQSAEWIVHHGSVLRGEVPMKLRSVTAVVVVLTACAEPPTLATREQAVVAPPELDAWIADHQIPLATVE